MKFRIILVLLTILYPLISCTEKPPKDEDTPLEHNTEESIHKVADGDLEIIDIDGCQYIVYKEVESANRAFGYMAHKGNCANPIHSCTNLKITPDSLNN